MRKKCRSEIMVTKEDALIYRTHMNTIRLRIEVIGENIAQMQKYGMSNVIAEFCSLQLRMILESIAFCSLFVDKDIYTKAHESIHTWWRAKKIVEAMEKINPQFYPQAVISEDVLTPTPKDSTKVAHKITTKKGGFLTVSEFIFLYDKCSETLHSSSPFEDKNIYEERLKYWEKNLVPWTAKLVGLLNQHIIRLADGENVLLVSMTSKSTGKPEAFLLSH